MNCNYSFAKESKLMSHENVCKDYGCCHTVMSQEGKNFLKYKQDKRYFKALFIICANKDNLSQPGLKKFTHVITVQNSLPKQK